jgi:DNA polymerase gamma 1
LRLTWDGYPVHFDEALGWGYLIPGRNDPKLEHLIMAGIESDVSAFPVKYVAHFLFANCFQSVLINIPCFVIDNDSLPYGTLT